MGLNFPSSPADGQVFPPFVYNTAKGTWRRFAGTALRKNLIINPSMQISQQNGDTASQANGYYPADQWCVKYELVTGAVISTQRVAAVTPRGSPYRFRVSVVTADTTLVNGEFLVVQQYIEGNRVANLNFGAAAARAIVLRFGFKGPAGTYAISLGNGNGTRNYLKAFTISAGQANTDTEQVFAIPGDVTGTWFRDTQLGLSVSIALASTPMYNGVEGWQAGLWIGVSGVSNGVASTSNVFELFDFGLYADPYLTGVSPEFEVPLYEDDLSECMRYWTRFYGGRGFTTTSASAALAGLTATLQSPMRAIPAVTLVGTVRNYDWAAVPNSTGVAIGYSNANVLSIQSSYSAVMTAGRMGAMLVDDQEANYVAVNGRM